jgi:membrane-bound serine protease (ClpP class)
MIADAAPWVTFGAWTTGQLAGVVITLMVAGFLLLGAEVFVIPGFGVAGVLGIVSLGSGVVIAWASWGVGAGLTLLLGSLAGTVIFVVLFFKSRVGNRLVLGSSLEDTHALSDADRRLIGQRGVAVTMLRPSGVAEFGEDRVEVETDGSYIPRGSPVVVTDVAMGRVVVELAPAEVDAPAEPQEKRETKDG